MPISVNLSAGSKITVLGDGGTAIKVLNQPILKFKIVSAGPQGISAFGVWLTENPGSSLDDYFEAISAESGSVAAISSDADNALTTGTDGEMFVPANIDLGTFN